MLRFGANHVKAKLRAAGSAQDVPWRRDRGGREPRGGACGERAPRAKKNTRSLLPRSRVSVSRFRESGPNQTGPGRVPSVWPKKLVAEKRGELRALAEQEGGRLRSMDDARGRKSRALRRPAARKGEWSGAQASKAKRTSEGDANKQSGHRPATCREPIGKQEEGSKRPEKG